MYVLYPVWSMEHGARMYTQQSLCIYDSIGSQSMIVRGLQSAMSGVRSPDAVGRGTVL